MQNYKVSWHRPRHWPPSFSTSNEIKEKKRTNNYTICKSCVFNCKLSFLFATLLFASSYPSITTLDIFDATESAQFD